MSLLWKEALKYKGIRTLYVPFPTRIMSEICELNDTTPGELGCSYDNLMNMYYCRFAYEDEFGRMIINIDLLLALMKWLLYTNLESTVEKNKTKRIPLLEKLAEKGLLGKTSEELPELIRKVIREEINKLGERIYIPSTSSKVPIPSSINYSWQVSLQSPLKYATQNQSQTASAQKGSESGS